jgi:hypothetical protein
MQARYICAVDKSEKALVRRTKKLFMTDLGAVCEERRDPRTGMRQFEGYVAPDYEFFLIVKWKSPSRSRAIVMFDVTSDSDIDIQLLKDLVVNAAEQHFSNLTLVYHSLGRARNLEAFPLLLDFENVVRELIVQVMSSLHGKNWWTQVHADIQRRAADYERYRRENRLHNYIESQPVYYVDLKDLRKIIEDEDAISGTFSNIFNNYDRVDMPAKIGEIRDLRNRVMHGDYLTVDNLATIRIICGQFARFLVAPNLVGDFEDRHLDG